MSRFNVFIGFDRREQEAYHVCCRSLTRHSGVPLRVHALMEDHLRAMGMYWRTHGERQGQRIDLVDGKPFSTDFTFTRFLVPALCDYSGMALFCDIDFLWRADVADLFMLFDPSKAVMCVQHKHEPGESLKMDGQVQQPYRRKNWSSLILWNCGHPSNEALTVDAVNMKDGRWLHGFGWLQDHEIGSLPMGWNYLVGWNTKAAEPNPRAVHFTEGVPTMAGYENCEYADEWRAELNPRTVTHVV